jgi:deoxycytidylate deaminase
MAQYTIKHTCGHEEVVNICGTNVHGERDRKVAWLESKPCHECEKSQFEG